MRPGGVEGFGGVGSSHGGSTSIIIPINSY